MRTVRYFYSTVTLSPTLITRIYPSEIEEEDVSRFVCGYINHCNQIITDVLSIDNILRKVV